MPQLFLGSLKGLAGQLLANFFLPLVTVPQVFANVASAQFPARISLERRILPDTDVDLFIFDDIPVQVTIVYPAGKCIILIIIHSKIFFRF